jgi:hypothetical protein
MSSQQAKVGEPVRRKFIDAGFRGAAAVDFGCAEAQARREKGAE